MNAKTLARILGKIGSPNEYGCWPWLGSRYLNGYSQIWYEGRTVNAHRLIFKVYRGEIPDGLTIDHLCNNRNCVNPDHLSLATQRDNVLRGNAPTAINARKTHCSAGHEFTPDNTRIHRKKDGPRRVCLTCQRARYSRERN